MSMTTAHVGHFMRRVGRLSGPKPAPTHVYFVFFPVKRGSGSGWLMIQTQKLQKLHRQERQGRQLSLFSELLYRRVYNDHETATWNMSESTSFRDIMPDILSSSVHGRKFERTVLTFKKMPNFSTGCRQRHGEVKKAWAVLLICCQDYPILNYTCKDLTHLLSRTRIFENLLGAETA